MEDPAIFSRSEAREQLVRFLDTFAEHSKTDLSITRGIYVRGNVGVGKTEFVMKTLREQGYSITLLDSRVLRTKGLFESISQNNLPSVNVMSQFRQTACPSAIVVDEIDGMISGDKGGLSSLIKLIQPKKTKRQKKEPTTLNPVICIGNYMVDKKIGELIRMCQVLDLSDPPPEAIERIFTSRTLATNPDDIRTIVSFVQCDLRKLDAICRLWGVNNSAPPIVLQHLQTTVRRSLSNKGITQRILSKPHTMSELAQEIPEQPRTTVGLLLHENAIDLLPLLPPEDRLNVYANFLDNFCYGDYIDRVVFQRQIWEINDMSVITKIYANTQLLHQAFSKAGRTAPLIPEVRFTKVLTKYSTEYGNEQFFCYLCEQLNWDITDVVGYFTWLRGQPQEFITAASTRLIEEMGIEPAAIRRMFQFLNKYLIPTAIEERADDDDDEDEEFIIEENEEEDGEECDL